GRVDDRRPGAEATRPREQLDRADAVLGDALVDLARLLVGMYVQDEPFAPGVAADLLEPVGGTGANRVGGEPDAQPVRPQRLDLAEVVGNRLLAEARAAPARVGGVQDDDLDPGLLGRGGRGPRLLEPEIVELTHGRIPRFEQLAVDVDVSESHALG